MTRPIILRDEATRERLLDAIRRLNIEKPWKVTIERYVKRRSVSQNALLHSWLGIIAESTGNSLDSLKDAYKDMFLPMVPIQLGDEEKMVRRSTATLDTKEMSAFMDAIYAHATGELGILLPLPEEGFLDGKQ